MTSLDLQQVMASRFRTSLTADAYTKSLMEGLGLTTKAGVARLAIGRSLSLGALGEETTDSKGMEIPATSLFTREDAPLWVGLLIAHSRRYGDGLVNDLETLRSRIRQHWHRGVGLLQEDWSQAGENFDDFVATLIRRRANLPDHGAVRKDAGDAAKSAVSVQDKSSEVSKALREIGVSAEVSGVVHGPRLSRYQLIFKDLSQLDKLRRGLEMLSLALNLGSHLPHVAPGSEARTVILELPRPPAQWRFPDRDDFVQAIRSKPRQEVSLVVSPGTDVVGAPFFLDLEAAPHLLVGGATGKGKSVCVHALLCSLIATNDPFRLQLALLDPKQVEFNVYSKSQYLWRGQIAIGMEQCGDVLDALVEEMDSRYSQMNEIGVNNIRDAARKGKRLPYIVVCIDELADLVIQDKEIEAKIIRLAQLARAAGIHLILATQRPDAKTFSGLIRSNVPARIALTVQKSTESQIILDEPGAETLLGRGDMLVRTEGGALNRVHGYYLGLDDVEKLLRA